MPYDRDVELSTTCEGISEGGLEGAGLNIEDT